MKLIYVFLFLKGTIVGLIPPNYNHYFEEKKVIKIDCNQKDSRINPTLSICSLSPIL